MSPATPATSARPPVAVVHDYFTQRGGAERVALAMADAFPGAPVYTSLYEPAGTFPDVGRHQVRTSPLDKVGLLRRHHRAALPLLPLAFGRMEVDAEVVLCSSSGFAHGVAATGPKVVYCYSPAKWLYQPDRYLRGRLRAARPLLGLAAGPLRRWDQRAAAGAARYLVTSTAVRGWVVDAYGIDAEVLPPPCTVDPSGPATDPGLPAGHLLCVSRLLPYKNVDVLVEAARSVPDLRVVVAGDGLQRPELEAAAPPNVRFLGAVDDATLTWLYANCVGVVCPSYEDFGLVPVEAAFFAKPTAALRWGGFVDTVVEGRTGVFFDRPAAGDVVGALRALVSTAWDAEAIQAHAAGYRPAAFADRLRRVVAEVAR